LFIFLSLFTSTKDTEGLFLCLLYSNESESGQSLE
jgi:hypothetical protein